jgi:predicted tellurium resistance membrane protein TerC
MSTDNVLGVAAASDGDVRLLILGLVLSMAILMFLGSLVADLVNRFWWLAYLGAAVIAWTGAVMAFDDPIVDQGGVIRYGAAAAITLGTLAFAHWYHRVRST